jgi:DNA repair protein RadC
MSQTVPAMVYEAMKAQYGIPKVIRVTCSSDILQHRKVAELSKKQVENFCIITLNGASEIIRFHTITVGLLNHSLIHPREVFRIAIKENAHSIICIHNHPSGNLEPSSQDLQVTKQLKEAGDIIGISVLDHIIVSKSGIASMRECGYL